MLANEPPQRHPVCIYINMCFNKTQNFVSQHAITMEAFSEFLDQHKRWRQFLRQHSRPLNSAQDILTLHDLGGFRETGTPMPITKSEAELLANRVSIKKIPDNPSLLCFGSYQFKNIH